MAVPGVKRPLGLTLVLVLAACQSPRATPPRRTEVLVMADNHGTIFTVQVDGTHKVLLPARGRTPSWTPDGRIVFVRMPGSQVWAMDADGANAHQLGELHLDGGNPIVKPQIANGLVLFSDMQGRPSRRADNPGPQNGAWVMHQDGSGLRLLALHCTAAALARSGRWISCTKETHGHREIWRVNTDGTDLRQLTFPTTDSGYPDANASAISPDESMIAFFSGKESDLGTSGFTQSVLTWGPRDVAVIPASGGTRRTVTHCQPVTTVAEVRALPAGACIAADNPAWSPDGARLVFDRGSPRPRDGGTWEIGVDGRGEHRLWPETRGGGNVPLR